MYITRHVNIPDEILRAREDGKLVVFAGAGVSMGPPSCLPNFPQLVKQIAEQCAEVFNERKHPAFDEYLGELDIKYGKVNERVRAIIGRPDSSPNILHRDISQLFTADNLRIVTTNFDRHFSTAIEKLKAEGHFDMLPNEFSAPALPRGNKFKGVVYLHGNIAQDAEELIVTDTDFGRAYLSEGWASDFVRTLYGSDYTILFIGYSHSDPMLKYLARGLRIRKNNKFSFVSGKEIRKGKDAFWSSLGVGVISFPTSKKKNKGEFFRLEEAVSELARQFNMGFLDHTNRIQSIAKAKPPIRNEESDYIQYILTRVDLAKQFCSEALSYDWLEWASINGILDSLFSSKSTELTEIERALSNWLAEIASQDTSLKTIKLIASQRKDIHPEVVYYLVRALVHKEMPKNAENDCILSEWLMLILDNSRSRIVYPLEWVIDMLEKKFSALNKSLVLTVADFLFRFVDNRQSSVFENLVLHDVKPLADENTIKEFWQRILKPRLAELSGDLLELLTHKFVSIFKKLKATGSADENWDHFSVMRSSIEKQESVREESIDLLIDILREAIDFQIMDSDSDRLLHYNNWKHSKMPLLERLFLYCVKKDDYYSNDEKVNIILKSDWLFKSFLEVEVQAILTESSELSHNTVLSLEACFADKEKEIRALDDGEKKRVFYRELYNRLLWTKESKNSTDYVNNTVTRIEEQYGFKPSTEVLKRGVRSYPVTFVSPKSVDELRRMPFPELIELMNRFAAPVHKQEEDRVLEYSNYAILNQVTEIVSTDWKYAESLLEYLNQSELNKSLWHALSYGLTKAKKESVHWDSVIEQLSSTRDKDEIIAEIAMILESFPREDLTISSSLLQKGIDLAIYCFKRLRNNEKSVLLTEEKKPEWLMRAINQPSGRLAMFMIIVLYNAVKSNYKDKELRYKIIEFLELILSGKTFSDGIGRTIIASQLHVLFYIDQDWCKRKVVTAFDWNKPKRALQAWCGFLGWCNYNIPILGGILKYIKQTIEKIDLINERYTPRFYALLSDVLFFLLDGEDRNSFLRFVIAAGNQALLEGVHRSIKARMKDLGEEKALEAWSNWIREYVRDRANGEYAKNFSFEEASITIDMLSEHKDLFIEGAGYLAEALGTKGNQDNWWMPKFLNNNELCEKNADLCAELLSKWLKTKKQVYLTQNCRASVDSVIERCKDEGLKRSLIEECIRLRIRDY
ncbi:SIR2 family protein [Mesotoga sp. H07.pep.5.3]|uniref:SIR2 family protein n=1 Tax=Mesotoga sp. H07.pep.5.3 TaxID=1421003 RepID=UPI000C1811CC|nr:SIR2 family protein [Mesotoga sp. H07.pep.5.3]PIJ60676.1 hypothetical protein V513_12345 [Mesotoga sp. H07.pep.5.3]